MFLDVRQRIVQRLFRGDSETATQGPARQICIDRFVSMNFASRNRLDDSYLEVDILFESNSLSDLSVRERSGAVTKLGRLPS